MSWEWHDPESQPVMEVYQGFRSSYEYAGALPEESRKDLWPPREDKLHTHWKPAAHAVCARLLAEEIGRLGP